MSTLDFIIVISNGKQIGSFSQVQHAVLLLLVVFIWNLQPCPIFQQSFRWFQDVKKYVPSSHYISVLATTEANIQT